MSLPIPNSYWVRPGLLLAGEYPGHHDAAHAAERIAGFHDAGVRCYVDLTAEEDGLAPYAAILSERSRDTIGGVTCVRHAIPDMDVPPPATMHRILDDIDDAIAAKRLTYVHCWGGVGRTGTVIGCHLVRHGWTGEAALDEVGRLFATTKKAWRFPEGSPQTEAQRSVVRTWAKHETVRRMPPASADAGESASSPRNKPTAGTLPTLRDRFRGALLGLAVGDAVGSAVEFKTPGSFPPVSDMIGGGAFNLAPGQWTDDTSMALCLAESLIECAAFDARDQMQRYVRWRDEGHLSSTGTCVDIGTTTARALRAFDATGEPFSGSTEQRKAGNGSLMRLAPVPLFFFLDPESACERAAESSRTTHGASSAVDACRYFAMLLVQALRSASKTYLLSPNVITDSAYWSDHALEPAVAAVAAGSFTRKNPPEIRGTGYVVESLEAALWAFHRSDNFRDGCLLAANLGDDADTTAAIYGQLAGAFYSAEGIPHEWRARVAKRDLIEEFCDRLHTMSMRTRS